jgi:hypothetical protein
MDVNIAHPGKDQAVVTVLDVSMTERRSHGRDRVPFDKNLPRTDTRGTDELA